MSNVLLRGSFKSHKTCAFLKNSEIDILVTNHHFSQSAKLCIYLYGVLRTAGFYRIKSRVLPHFWDFSPLCKAEVTADRPDHLFGRRQGIPELNLELSVVFICWTTCAQIRNAPGTEHQGLTSMAAFCIPSRADPQAERIFFLLIDHSLDWGRRVYSSWHHFKLMAKFPLTFNSQELYIYVHVYILSI